MSSSENQPNTENDLTLSALGMIDAETVPAELGSADDMTQSTPKPKVLLVDDEPNILQAVKRVLRKKNFDITITNSPEEAAQILEQETFAVIISDQRMPEMNGAALLAKARKVSPDTYRILLTGYSDITAAIDAVNDGGIYRFLTKPWDDENLQETVQEAVNQYNLVTENKRLEALAKKQNVELKVLNSELKELNESLEEKVEERTGEVKKLNKLLEERFFDTVQVMANMAEMHSSVLGNHSKRVCALSKALALRLGITEGSADLFQIEIAATLHDIGKISIPPSVLEKPGNRLNETEKQLMQRHPVQGENILKTLPGLEQAATIIRHHHENYDGSGYPDKLRGDRIPLGAKIIAVADLYDKALNSKDAIKTMTPEKALEFVQRFVSKMFDPVVVEALAQHVRSPKAAQDEIEIFSRDLQADMVLSRDLLTVRGVLLLPKKATIPENQLAQLKAYLEMDPPADGVYIYR